MEQINRGKQLVKNTAILSIGTLSSKVFSFFLLPLYTSALSTEDYGSVDVLQTIIFLLVPVVTLQLSGAVFRFLIDKNEDNNYEKVITSSFFLVGINIILVCLFTIVVNTIYPIPHCALFIISFAANSCCLMMQSVSRGFGHNTAYAICSFLLVFVSLILNIILIIGIGLKGESILIALIVSNCCGAIFLFIKERIWNYLTIKAFSIAKLREMLAYSLPLIPNAISWWIANTSDRLLIVAYLGSGFNGIYAAANKIPTIYTTIYNVFGLAWTESVSRSQDDEDKELFINSMLITSYKFFGCLCLGIICCVSLVFNKLIGANYADAYNHVYILLVAIFINSMCSMYGGIFTGYKQSKTIGSTTVVGAIINVFFNFLFIRYIGLYAASISTLISYITIMIIRIYKVQALARLDWPKGFFVRMAIMLVVVTYGYFSRTVIINLLVLAIMIGWSYFENRHLVSKLIGEFIKKGKR